MEVGETGKLRDQEASCIISWMERKIWDYGYMCQKDSPNVNMDVSKPYKENFQRE